MMPVFVFFSITLRIECFLHTNCSKTKETSPTAADSTQLWYWRGMTSLLLQHDSWNKWLKLPNIVSDEVQKSLQIHSTKGRQLGSSSLNLNTYSCFSDYHPRLPCNVGRSRDIQWTISVIQSRHLKQVRQTGPQKCLPRTLIADVCPLEWGGSPSELQGIGSAFTSHSELAERILIASLTQLFLFL